MSVIEKVALAGATGNLGPAILTGLCDGGYQVTVLTRKDSKHSFPEDVVVKAVDYNSMASLTNALKGQDAVVCTLGASALPLQLQLIEAAIKAGVKRFIPSEFGSNTVNEKAAQLPSYADKVATQKALKKAADDGKITYTIICNGPFFDWGIMVGFVMNLKEKTINLYNGGNSVFSTSRLSTVGKAVAGVLRHPEETKNRTVYVQDTAITQKKLAEMGKVATGPEGWKEPVVSIDDQLDQAWAELKKENPRPEIFVYNFLKAAIWGGDDYGAHFEEVDNELLGIQEMTDAEIQEMVNSYA